MRYVAGQVREARKRHGWTAARLGEEMTKVGFAWDRFVVTKLETGRRQTLTIDELLALGYVLGVAPIHLLVPTDDEEAPYPIVPTSGVGAGRARQWMRGLYPLPSTDRRFYFNFVPEREWVPAGGFRVPPGSFLEAHEDEVQDAIRRGDRRREADDDGR